jgi:hypothetical protein
MSTYTRNRKRWTINECIELQREYELLELSIDEIAMKHKRTPKAIMFRLDHEGFADYNVLHSKYNNLDLNTTSVEETLKITEDNYHDKEENEENEKNEENEENDNDLKAHIIRLEKQISNLTQLFMMQNKNSKSVLSLFE